MYLASEEDNNQDHIEVKKKLTPSSQVLHRLWYLTGRIETVPKKSKNSVYR